MDGEYNGQDLRFPYPGFPVRWCVRFVLVCPTRADNVFCGVQVAPTIKFDWATFDRVAGATEVSSVPCGLPVAVWTIPTHTCVDTPQQIRGCAFEHTATRELMMSGTLDDALKPLHFRCGMSPVAMWKYDIPEAPHPLVRALVEAPLPPHCRCLSTPHLRPTAGAACPHTGCGSWCGISGCEGVCRI